MTETVSAFERLARVAAEVMGAPMALVTVIDGQRQRYRAVHGGAFGECAAEDSFCASLADRGPGATLVVPDAAADALFGGKPAVIDGTVRFYAGAAVTRTDGGFDGAVCVIDAEPRAEPSEPQLRVLKELAALAAELIEAESAREAAYRTVAASEARYRLLAENTTDVIAAIGMDGRNTFVSEACRSVLGIEPETLIGRSTLEIVHPEDAPGLEAAFRKLVRDNRPRLDHPVRYRARAADGAWRWVEANPTLLFAKDGQPERFVDVVRDVTRQVETERELQDARSAAEAGAVAKAEFLANMSHELRTPLTAIIGFAGLLKQYGALSEQDRRFVDRIAASADTLLAMVGDVLDYSKLEAGAVELHQEPVEIGPLLQDTLAMVGPAAAAKWLTVAVHTHGLVAPCLTADRTRLRQVLMNLLSNAVKFTAEGSVTLKAESVDGGRVLFSVADTGCGVPADRQHRLFRRFSQADGSTVRDYGGSGLGLAICKALIEAMGGEIGFTSTEGEGSTFWFLLPADGVEAARAAAA